MPARRTVRGAEGGGGRPRALGNRRSRAARAAQTSRERLPSQAPAPAPPRYDIWGARGRGDESMIDDVLSELKQGIEKAKDALRRDLGKLRTGRAHPGMLETLRVDYYGQSTPI